MKLLICTQKIDRNDPILGFFHRWVKEFAKHSGQVTVICLEKGEYDLPQNVRVLSLGKEEGKGRLTYLSRFYRYIWHERTNYDAIFVHMNQEYVLLGWLPWRLLGKRIFMWRNHAKGSWLTRLAVLLSDKVFCTSPQSFTANFKKTELMSVGVDTDFFKPDSSVHKRPHSILFLGRIAPVKRVDMFIEALRILKDKGIDFTATIAGNSLPRDAEYETMIRNKVLTHGLSSQVVFTGSASRTQARDLYREHELYVNLTPSGSLDKTIFEALASGLKVVISNNFFEGKLPKRWVITDDSDAHVIAATLEDVLSEGSEIVNDIASFTKKHSLKSLMDVLVTAMNASSAK
ncbi:MAG: glycosyltransferase family 4 protein [Candidatus Pacebacteria bacterium]|nr:glycosyltransferase family 4 protein [Candidatus Paceibacterota bacterium]